MALIAGLLLYVFAVVLDHADGEVARLTMSESALGEWLDAVIDTVVHTTLVLALGVAAGHLSGGGQVAGMIAAVGVLAGGLVGKLWPPAPPRRGATSSTASRPATASTRCCRCSC